MTKSAVYSYARRHGHTIVKIPYKKIISAAVQFPNGQCCIGIDLDKVQTDAEEKTILLHELGHCETGAFYTRWSPVDNRAKCEAAADRWAIRKELGYKKLCRAIQAGCTETYELADYFGVSEEMIRKALRYYKLRGLKFYIGKDE